jgi:hypothetical protein
MKTFAWTVFALLSAQKALGGSFDKRACGALEPGQAGGVPGCLPIADLTKSPSLPAPAATATAGIVVGAINGCPAASIDARGGVVGCILAPEVQVNSTSTSTTATSTLTSSTFASITTALTTGSIGGTENAQVRATVTVTVTVGANGERVAVTTTRRRKHNHD